MLFLFIYNETYLVIRLVIISSIILTNNLRIIILELLLTRNKLFKNCFYIRKLLLLNLGKIFKKIS
jgi:hypothetical protein